MSRRQLLISLPPRIRSRVDQEAKRDKRSHSSVILDALELYFRLRSVGGETVTDKERLAISEGRRDYARGDVVTLKEWRRGMGLGNHQARGTRP